MTTIISISLCHSTLEFNSGERYDETLLLDAIRNFAKRVYPHGVTFAALQVGSDEWAYVDGDPDDGVLFLDRFFDSHAADPRLFAAA